MLEVSKRLPRCMICNRDFVLRESMMIHMRRKHAGLFIVCKHNGHCAEIFRTEAEKAEHILQITQITNKKDKLVKCDFCFLMYWKSSKANHFKINHKNDNLIRCSYWNCSTYFRSEVEKQNHEALVHVTNKKQKCIFCNNFFTKINIFRHYQRNHKTLFANAFKCKFHCKRYFLTEADREEHIARAH